MSREAEAKRTGRKTAEAAEARGKNERICTAVKEHTKAIRWDCCLPRWRIYHYSYIMSSRRNLNTPKIEKCPVKFGDLSSCGNCGTSSAVRSSGPSIAVRDAVSRRTATRTAKGRISRPTRPYARRSRRDALPFRIHRHRRLNQLAGAREKATRREA